MNGDEALNCPHCRRRNWADVQASEPASAEREDPGSRARPGATPKDLLGMWVEDVQLDDTEML